MPAFDPLTYRYASRRNVVYAKNAVACTCCAARRTNWTWT